MVASIDFITILGFFVVVPVHAQVLFGDWVGIWFKGSVKEKGLMVDEFGTDKAVDKIPTYGYVQSWDEVNQQFTSLLIQFDDDSNTWMDAVPYVVTVVNGTPLDYVAYGFIPPGTLPEIEIFALIMSAKGKEKAGVITKGSVKTVGGCIIYNLGDGINFSANESLQMKLIKEEKVPQEVYEKVFPP